MRLEELTADLSSAVASGQPAAGGDVAIRGLAYDSRTVRPGDLFLCVSGFQSDGHDFAEQAVSRGAAALIVERRLGLSVPEVLVSSSREAMGPIGARLYGHPTAGAAAVGIPAQTANAT